MTVEQHTPVNPVAAAQAKPTNELFQLQQQITELTAQVTTLTTRQASLNMSPAFTEKSPKRCFICSRVGHQILKLHDSIQGPFSPPSTECLQTPLMYVRSYNYCLAI